MTVLTYAPDGVQSAVFDAVLSALSAAEVTGYAEDFVLRRELSPFDVDAQWRAERIEWHLADRAPGVPVLLDVDGSPWPDNDDLVLDAAGTPFP